jgi:hypothetical protein
MNNKEELERFPVSFDYYHSPVAIILNKNCKQYCDRTVVEGERPLK